MQKVKVAIMVSGNGSNMQALIKHQLENHNNPDFPYEVMLVISNNKQAKAIDFALANNINYQIIEHNNFNNRQEFEVAIDRLLRNYQIEVICLAGFMRILSEFFVNLWQDRIINIHPSLLPSFKGANAVADAMKYGVKITGCTTHIVNKEVDSGRILMQSAVEMLPEDDQITIANKIHQQEHIIYPQTLKLFCQEILQLNI
jgi:formyltetrahydrofolate-dependent phosphoribosylglycinamide formyltransferase